MEQSGWLNVNKPINCTSTKIVAIIKRITKAKKVGHGGTLDPLASGVLPICINKATKQVESMMNHTKTYLFHLTFGEFRDTYDSEGVILEKNDFIPADEDIKNIINNFIGIIQQMPPIYSAIKVNGKRACDLTRDGVAVELKARPITINSIIYNGFINANTVEFVVDCGRGCYIRSLGIDIAKQLNAIAYVSKIERLRVGDFDIKDSLNFDDFNLENIVNKIRFVL